LPPWFFLVFATKQTKILLRALISARVSRRDRPVWWGVILQLFPPVYNALHRRGSCNLVSTPPNQRIAEWRVPSGIYPRQHPFPAIVAIYSKAVLSGVSSFRPRPNRNGCRRKRLNVMARPRTKLHSSLGLGSVAALRILAEALTANLLRAARSDAARSWGTCVSPSRPPAVRRIHWLRTQPLVVFSRARPPFVLPGS